MKISEIKTALAILSTPVPPFIETDGLYRTWEWGSDIWFSWDIPVSYQVPAVLWNREDGLLLVKKVEAKGAGHRGVGYPMTGPYLVFHLWRRAHGGLLSPLDVLTFNKAIIGERMPSAEEKYVQFDRRAVVARIKERGHGDGTKAEEVAVLFNGKILL